MQPFSSGLVLSQKETVLPYTRRTLKKNNIYQEDFVNWHDLPNEFVSNRIHFELNFVFVWLQNEPHG